MNQHKIGDMVTFVDRKGNSHNALVIYIWQTCLNIIYISPDMEEQDSKGHGRIIETSVPFFEFGMKGFYISEPLVNTCFDKKE